MAKDEDYKFGVEDLADKMGIAAASVRIKLRNANVKKAPTGRYGWKTKDELAKVAADLDKVKAAPAKKADAKPAKDDKKSKPAKDAKPAKGKADDKAKGADKAKAADKGSKGKTDTKSAKK